MAASPVLLPTERASVLAADRAELVLRLRVMVLELRALETRPDSPVSEDLSVLAGLRRVSAPLVQSLEEARASGWGKALELEPSTMSQSHGPRHPVMTTLQARRATVAERFGSETRLLLSMIEAAGPGPKAVQSALADGDVRRARELADSIALPSIQLSELPDDDSSVRPTGPA